MIYRLLFRFFISHTDPETAHEHTLKALQIAQKTAFGRLTLSLIGGRRPKNWVAGRKLGGPIIREVPGFLGLAAGMDKDARAVEAFSLLGFGFIEIGTVTPKAQVGNEKPRLFRLLKTREIRNCMGFNNEGALQVAQRLRLLRANKRTRSIIVGVNIGKNKCTEAEKAIDDYVYVAKILAPWADYLVVNVSSPNTVGLRDLQAVETLGPIVSAVKKAAQESANWQIPVLVKITGDLVDEDICAIAKMVTEEKLGGVVAVNTTVNHDLGNGGVSGTRLFDRSQQVVALLRKHLGPDPIIIGVGGVADAQQANALLNAGADLLQGLTAFVYAGPTWAARINRRLGKISRPQNILRK